ncbi:MAG: hypothetical protein WA322_22300, partial [Pseudolabrys sp.]
MLFIRLAFANAGAANACACGAQKNKFDNTSKLAAAFAFELLIGRQAFAISFSQRRISLLQLAHLSHR